MEDKVKDRTVILDIATTDSLGRRYNIEMQVNRDVNFIPRVLYYLDSLYISQLAGGVNFSKLRKTIGISFVDFLVFPGISWYFPPAQESTADSAIRSGMMDLFSLISRNCTFWNCRSFVVSLLRCCPPLWTGGSIFCTRESITNVQNNHH